MKGALTPPRVKRNENRAPRKERHPDCDVNPRPPVDGYRYVLILGSIEALVFLTVVPRQRDENMPFTTASRGAETVENLREKKIRE